ncbi:bestrophin family protein [Burkholderia cepacia]|uniref:bestrophin family protein n=1 Tax=Burkholderia cepacia TaxID=292 RepID=UPI001CF186B8|nr:bestrophin family protein [Burkholderia cepacia]MCA8355930.1 bestrophin family protein [Burkholderia cepacia]
MIIRPRENWFRLLFIWNGSVLSSIIPQLCLMAAVSTLAVFTHGRIFGEKIPLNTAPFTLFGVTLAIFLAFRNNTSYERFNEARRLWGSLLIASRSLTSQMLCYLSGQQDAFRITHKIIAFVYALKHELRGTDPSVDFQRLLGDEEAKILIGKIYKPMSLLGEIRRELSELNRKVGTSDTKLWMFDAQIDEMGKLLGGCERIASTPIPFSYNVLLHRTVYSYCILLPFGLVDSTEFFTPLLCVFISYTLIALEAIASEVAEPFSVAPNALALDAMSRNIERSLLELCGYPVPDSTKPIRPYIFT